MERAHRVIENCNICTDYVNHSYAREAADDDMQAVGATENKSSGLGNKFSFERKRERQSLYKYKTLYMF